MLVGDSRAGKTFFAGTFPRPIFLSDASEHGWTTLSYIPKEDLYEADHNPYAVGIETAKDMIDALVALEKQAAGQKVDLAAWPAPQGKDEIGTVVIDSLTFYADAFFAHLEAQAGGGRVDKRQLYGELGSHLRHLMIRFHRLPYHIVWTALSSVSESAQLRGALVSGQTAAKAPARCDCWFYLTKFERQSGDQTVVEYECHTQNYAGNKAGHRFGDRLDPIVEPNFRVIEESLGMEPWINRLGGVKKVSKARKAS